jgi:hypothetical protein
VGDDQHAVGRQAEVDLDAVRPVEQAAATAGRVFSTEEGPGEPRWA